MLKITNLTKTYAGSGVAAVDNLNLEVPDGKIYGFIGPNGAGKSTTIKCITGILSFESGSVTVDGKDLRSEPIAVKRQIGYVSDDHVLYERLTGMEFVNFMCDVFDVPTSERKKRLDRYADLFDLGCVLGDPIRSYSHGMKQKLNIIGALIHNPKLWVLDEPMTGLDPKSSYNLKQLMKEHTREGNSVFFSSHILDVVEKVCDKVGIIDHGKLVADCTVKELHENNVSSSLEDLFIAITADRTEDGFIVDNDGCKSETESAPQGEREQK